MNREPWLSSFLLRLRRAVKYSLSLLLGLAVGAVGSAAFAAFDAPPPTREQIEEDWLLQDVKRGAMPTGQTSVVTREEDAAGAVDGIKNGKWGFHTEFEENPWWQVDLRQLTRIGRIVLYNRCDFAQRNSRIKVSVSDDGQSFRQVYQHDGTVFYGFTDGKPLNVTLEDVTARFVRLSLSGKSYFHLDEVEVYPVGENRNVAWHQPATQSSTSPWSARSLSAPARVPAPHPLGQVIERGLRLVESQRRLGAKVEVEAERLQQIAAEWKQLSSDGSDARRQQLYLEAHWTVRAMALKNPLLNFDNLLFVKRAPAILPHMSDQHYGWWSRPGGGLYVLQGFKSNQPSVRCLTGGFPEGSFLGPDLSHDGKKVLFAYCRYYPQVAGMEKVDKEKLPADCFYKIYEMNIDGTGRRQLTQGRYDDFDPRYLPNGDIVFLSTRKGAAIQCSLHNSESTRDSTQPDSYVRCGGDNLRPCAVFTLHAMDAQGQNMRPVSAFENFEWTPSIAHDGRILYARWDYIDRFNGHFESLWSANQDGTNPQLVYGNYTVKPQAVFEARAIPGSSKLVFTASAHHSITGGSLCLLDRAKGLEDEAPLTRLTPEVCFPETEGWPEHYYANPYPLSEEYFLVGWATHKLPPHAGSTPVSDARNPVNAMGIYLLDAFGNQELLYRDPDITSMYPLPLAARPKPVAHSSAVDWQGTQEGRFLMQDVYEGMPGVARGAVKTLRIVGVVPKVQPHMNQPMLGVSAEDTGKFVLGTVPVEADGSAFFRVPSGVPVFFQALNEDGQAVQTMRTLTYVQPNQTLSCIGCHESRDRAPAVLKFPLAARRAPSNLTPGPSGSWPLRYDQLVQPVLDRWCVRCHQSGGGDGLAAKLDLTLAQSYLNLISFGGENLKKAAFERDRSLVGQGTAGTSRLWHLLAQGQGHQGIQLDAESRQRLLTWLDTYAQRQGSFSDQQERELVQWRARWGGMLDQR